MMYPFMTLEDNTEIVHSDIIDSSADPRVVVYIEKPIDGGFRSAKCILPSYTWEAVVGYSDGEIAKLQEIVESVAHIIFDLARNGGFANAANL